MRGSQPSSVRARVVSNKGTASAMASHPGGVVTGIRPMRAAWFKDPDGNILSLVNQAM